MRAGHQRLSLVAVAALTLLCVCSVVAAQLDVHLDLANDARFNKTKEESTTTRRVSAIVTDANVKLNDIQHSEIGKHAAKKVAAAVAAAAAAAPADDQDDQDDTYDDDEYEYDDELYGDLMSTDKKEPQQTIVKKPVGKHVRTWDLKPIKADEHNALDNAKSPTTKPTKAAAHPSNKAAPQRIDDGGLTGENADDDGPASDDTDNFGDDEDDEDDLYDDDEDENDDADIGTPSSSTAKPKLAAARPTLAAAATTKPKLSTTRASASPAPAHACPQNCVCERNYNGFMVANCDRLDAETMHFDQSITDLEVFNVAPRYPLLFDADFFKRIGLLHVRSIAIVDATIENVHPDAFRGLDQLYSVNLTNTGLDMLPPDAFAGCPKLRILSLTGNDLHAMQAKSSPFVDYMLNAPSLEELYLTNCNIKQLLETSFKRLPNLVFVSLANNMLETLPHAIFHGLSALEEVDVSSNSIVNLPRHVFDNTSLSILTMRYNELSGRPAFVAHNLQKLDLSYNKLQNINDMFFTDMPNLNNLGLKGNAIRKVHHAAFAPLKDLRHIDLSFNDLEQVSAILFLENGYLDTIRLNDNARLKKLPLDGFASALKDFNVYLFDASNCDLSELGENTFATMPKLTTLNLSWNNIESVGSGLFSYLKKLVSLDLSNNLLSEVSDMLFLHNRELHKLNLAGNPFERLSSKVFLPAKQLTQLDLSDCNLKSIWTEQTDMTGVHPKNLLKNLKSLNVSNNEISRVQLADLTALEHLAVFDVSNNQLNCDREFRDVMKYLEKKKIASGQLRTFVHELATEAELKALAVKRSPWEEYSLMRCKKLVVAATKPTAKPQRINRPIVTDGDAMAAEHDDDDGPADDDDDDIVDSINDKANEKTHADDQLDDGEYDDDDGADDDEDVEIELASKGEKEIRLSAGLINHGIRVTEVKKKPAATVVDSAEMDGNFSDETDDEDDEDDEDDDEEANIQESKNNNGLSKTVGGKSDDGSKNVVVSVDENEEDADDEDDDDDSDDESSDENADEEEFVPLEHRGDDADGFRAQILYTYDQYSYLLPLFLTMFFVFVLLAIVAKIVSVMARRRGERYRLALLASKNSIVYQKLSEEIGTPATPKFHRYAPIQQV